MTRQCPALWRGLVEELDKLQDEAIMALRRLKAQMEEKMEARTLDYGAIGWAVNHARHGHKVRRKGWTNSTYVLFVPAGSVQIPQKFGDGLNTAAALFMKTAQDELVPWSASQSDLLADDWELVNQTQPGVYS